MILVEYKYYHETLDILRGKIDPKYHYIFKSKKQTHRLYLTSMRCFF